MGAMSQIAKVVQLLADKVFNHSIKKCVAFIFLVQP